MRKQDEQMPTADEGPVERMVRPQCWAFAMEFLGEPEAPVVEAYVASLETDIARLRVALKRIARWHGELPDSGRQWPDGQPMSYAAAFGSNGERDYMRQVALDALGPNAELTGVPLAARPVE